VRRDPLSLPPDSEKRPTFIAQSGSEVEELQRLLAKLGFAPGNVDGVLGPRTADAVRKFQKENGLTADGLVGPATWNALQRAAAAAPRAPSRSTRAPSSATDGESPEVSDAVRDMERRLGGRVGASAIVRELLNSESDGLTGRVDFGEEPKTAQQRYVHEWLEDVRPLFSRRRAPILDAGLVAWGLALLDHDVWKRLRKDAFLDRISHDGEMLTAAGRKRVPRADRKDTTAPTLLDRPAVEDRLGRRAFAIALAARIVQLRGTYRARSGRDRARITARVLWETVKKRLGSSTSPSAVVDGPFLVHLHGGWGTGKSSLLNFFSEQLARPTDELHEAVWGPTYEECPKIRPWAVVSFNAWQHQRVAPPWWWLMSAVFVGGSRSLPLHRRVLFHLRDYSWRFRARWPAFVVPLVGLFAIGSAIWYVTTETSAFKVGPETTWFEVLRGVATALSAALALLITAWGGVRALKGWMLVGTARGANDFMRTTGDPMAFVQRRYAHLVSSLGRPLAVVIDDLDRCQAAYVVEFLEGIQTLFATVPATYVVAADRRWLRDCFHAEYVAFSQANGDSGRPLGYQFLEKTFQLATSVPRLPRTSRADYLRTLLAPAEEAPHDGHERDRSAAREQARTLASEQEIRLALKQAEGRPAAKRETLREALVIRAAAKDITEQTEYLLTDFAGLLESNPRAMKRLVNAYSFETKLQLLEREWVEADEYGMQRLALWMIVSLRWPVLIDHLIEHPEWVENIVEGSGPPDDAPDDLQPLFKNERVRRVFKGEGVDVSLRPEHVRTLARLDDEPAPPGS
jgi:peptidoglycan hydrolase-like protein with peptidoglycan-binding domain